MLAAAALVLVFMLVVMLAAFAWQRAVSNTGWVDVFWTYGTGAAGIAVALVPMKDEAIGPRQLLVAALVGVWSLRLGTFVALRVAHGPEDARYQAFRQTWGANYDRNLFGLLMAQPPVSALLVLAIALAAHAPGPLGLRDLAAVLIMALAVGGESLADRQLTAFRRAGHGHGAICDQGLWGWSRHPNYFFEWLGWLAYSAIALDPSRPLSWASLGAPAVMYLVLRFGTGVPPLEASMLKSRGAAFRAYQARVNAFFPLPPKSPPRPSGAIS
jgi:steroid 5-alpha reductase family enzyme